MHKVPSGLQGYVRDGTHLVGWDTGALTPLLTMSLRVHLICSWHSVDTFHWACWMGRKEGSVLMVCIPYMFPMVLKEPENAHFKAVMSWATVVEGGVTVACGFMGLRADFGFVAGGLGCGP